MNKATQQVKSLQQCFSQLKAQNEAAFIPFLTMGYPSIEEMLPLMFALQDGGADVLELGIPFSDPMADGPTIQMSSQAALEQGINLGMCLELLSEARSKGLHLPVVLMGYCNNFLAFGAEALAQRLKEINVQGLIIPDLPSQETALFKPHLDACGIDLIGFVAPTTTEERVLANIRQASGFLYCIATKGVTGARSELDDQLEQFVSSISQKTRSPLCVGFGVSTEQHVQQISGFADGVIVASAIIERLKNWPKEQRVASLTQFTAQLKAATKRQAHPKGAR